MYEIGSMRALSTRVEDDRDDDPSVWDYYAQNLGEAFTYLRDADIGESTDRQAFMDDVVARADVVRQWIDIVESDNRMRRADVIQLLSIESIMARSASTRSGAIESLRDRVATIIRDKRNAMRAGDIF